MTDALSGELNLETSDEFHLQAHGRVFLIQFALSLILGRLFFGSISGNSTDQQVECDFDSSFSQFSYHLPSGVRQTFRLAASKVESNALKIVSILRSCAAHDTADIGDFPSRSDTYVASHFGGRTGINVNGNDLPQCIEFLATTFAELKQAHESKGLSTHDGLYEVVSLRTLISSPFGYRTTAVALDVLCDNGSVVPAVRSVNDQTIWYRGYRAGENAISFAMPENVLRLRALEAAFASNYPSGQPLAVISEGAELFVARLRSQGVLNEQPIDA
jgi:hypothetical protein